MIGIALELHRTTFPGAHVDAAAGGALGAAAGVERGYPGDLVLGLDQVRDQTLDLVCGAAGQCCGTGTGGAEHSQKAAAVEGWELVFVSHHRDPSLRSELP